MASTLMEATRYDASVFRSPNPFQTQTKTGIFTPKYESTTQLGPTKEALAKKQHAEDISNLSAEIAAKETPAAKKEREESGFFSRKSQESKLEAQKEQLKELKEKNALEEAVKKDKYFLIKNKWDKMIIMAANGETVTVEYEDTKAARLQDGTYPIKKLEITKSSKLRKISDTRAKPTGKTAAMVKEEFSKKKSSLMSKYEKGWLDDDKKDHKIIFSTTGKIMGGSATAIEEYKVELEALEKKRDQEIASIAAKADSAPAPQGLNVEPHTIAIHAPGFCMNDDCCLQLAFYTLRTAAKLIEDEGEAMVEKELKDVIKANKELHNELDEMYKDLDKMNKEVSETAEKAAAKEYAEAYKKYKTVTADSNGNPVNGGPKPDPKNYTAEVYIATHPEMEDHIREFELDIEEKDLEVSLSDSELEDKRKQALDRLVQDAKNYRLLLDHCTWQPKCPEWLEDAGKAVANAAKATGEAIASAAKWCWDGVSSAAMWVATGGITRTIDKVNGYLNDGLAYVSDLQTKLNEYLGFEGLCSLNPFGGTLGCSNCPMGSKCSGLKQSLTDKLKGANAANDFLKNLKGALGLGDGQILGNLLKCAAALTGEVSGAIGAVESFAIGTGAASLLGGASSILNTNALPNFNTKIADCISVGKSLDQAKSALDLVNKVGNNPVSVMSSKVPGLNTSAISLDRIDGASAGSKLFANLALGENKYSQVSKATEILKVEKPSGSTQYYDGKNVDVDSASKQRKQMEAAGLAYA